MSGRRAPRVADRLALLVASLGGVGYSPVAPGTAGSLVTVAGIWLLPFTPASLAVTLAVVIVVGIWAGGRVERLLGKKDPGLIVIDEVAGMLLSTLLLPRTPAPLLTAFLLFRLLDIWKPFPARESQALVGGLGVMLDDLIAGFYTLVLVMGSRVLFGVPA